jgi:hypothetical protein
LISIKTGTGKIKKDCNNLDAMEIKRSVATKKTPSWVHARGCTKFVASLRLLGWAAVSGDGVPPDLA